MSPLSAEWFFPVRRFVLTQLTSSSFSMERVCCVRIWHTSFVLVATYVRTLHTMQSKPSCWWQQDHGKYVCSCHMLHYCSKDWLLPACPPQSVGDSPKSCQHRCIVHRRTPSAPTLPQYVQANFPSTILGIQYDDSTVIINAILQMPQTILTALMPLNKSAYTVWRAGNLWQLRGNLSEIPQKFCDYSADDLRKTHAVNLRIM